jgi:hypothetical protein
LIARNLDRQMAEVASPEERALVDINRGEAAANLPKAGPSDVTSYHDFHDLQIAFEPIWTELFDSSLGRLIKDLYAEAVRYKLRVSGSAELPPVEDVRDMRELVDDLKALKSLTEPEARGPVPRGPIPSEIRDLVRNITDEEWAFLTETELREMAAVAAEVHRVNDRLLHPWGSYAERFAQYEPEYNALAARALAVVSAVRERLSRGAALPPPTATRPDSDRLGRLMDDLDKQLASNYAFDVFAPNSVNYGVMLTYRQRWVPLDYQVGNLVSTIPLAPKETRRYSTKVLKKTSRSQKEIEDVQRSRSADATDTARAESEIVSQARNATSFEQTAGGRFTVGAFEGEFGTRLGVQAEKSSAETKRNFREAVRKAAEEYKQQRRIEIDTSSSEETQTESGGEISNPNDEIAVTYLFYELQRQYEISERLHRVTPVVLVANDVPEPHEINDAWLIAHDWIIRRVLLDQTFLPALDYVRTSVAGDEMALQIMWANLKRQADLVDELKNQAAARTRIANEAFDKLKGLMEAADPAEAAKAMGNISMAIIFGPFSLAGGGGEDEAAKKREEVAKMALERAEKASEEISVKLAREVTALQEASDKYTSALRDHFDRQVAIARLRVHIKDNILHYMQAIWDHEPPDQRYFRLYNVDVPWIAEQRRPGPVEVVVTREPDGTSFLGDTRLRLEHREPSGERIPFYTRVSRKLSQIADLDNLLGYKGNYMIFRAREPSAVHLHQLQDYVDAGTGGLRDPDERAPPARELLDYICCVKRTSTPAAFEAWRPELLERLRASLTAPQPESELVVVPTTALHIEALPGKHPVMEDFKLSHRGLDVKKVQAEVRRSELENLRLAARLLEGNREDPDIDRKIVVEGVTSPVVPVEG